MGKNKATDLDLLGLHRTEMLRLQQLCCLLEHISPPRLTNGRQTHRGCGLSLNGQTTRRHARAGLELLRAVLAFLTLQGIVDHEFFFWDMLDPARCRVLVALKLRVTLYLTFQ